MLERVESFFFRPLLFDFFGLIAPGQLGRTKSLLLLLLSPCLCVLPILLAIPTLFQSVIRRLLLPLPPLTAFPIFPCAVTLRLPVNHCGGGKIRGLESLFCCVVFGILSFGRIAFKLEVVNGLSVASIRFWDRSRSRSRFVMMPALTLNSIGLVVVGFGMVLDSCWLLFGKLIWSATPSTFEWRR